MIEDAAQSAWIIPFIALGIGILTLWIISKLGKRFPRYTLVEYLPCIFGKKLGKALASSYILFFLIFSSLVLRQTIDFFKSSLLPSTPTWFTTLLFIMLASYGVLSGIEVITRASQFVLPIIIFGFLVMLFNAFPEIKLGELLPVFENGIISLIKGHILTASFFGEVIILAFLFPSVNKPFEVFKKVTIMLVILAVLLSIDVMLIITILGANLSSKIAIPLWQVIRYLEFGSTMLRVEIILIFLWIPSVVVKFALVYYINCLVVCQTFGLKSKYKAVIPVGLTIFGLSSFLFNNTIEVQGFLNNIWPIMALLFEIALPTFFLIVAKLRGKQKR